MDGSKDIEEKLLFASLPPEYPVDLTEHIERILRSVPDEIVVYLEDDSTGVQKSHDVYLITDSSKNGIRSGVLAARIAGHRLVFILTNSRALSTEKAEELNREIAQNLAEIGRDEKLTFRIGSRSDSTLRGHFPLEPLVLMKTLEPFLGKYDGIVVSYVFLTEMSRITVNGVHLLRMVEPNGSIWYRPIHLTRFAKDKRFGFITSNMAEYVEFKFTSSGMGVVKSKDVLYIDLDIIRRGGPDEVKRILLEAKNGRIIVLDVVSHRDLQVFVLGLLMAERAGSNYLYRSAASLPSARVNMKDIPILASKDIFGTKSLSGNILCLWGSIIELSNIQLEKVLRQIPELVPIKFDVRRVLKSYEEMEHVISSTARKTEDVLNKGRHVLIYTFPRMEYPPKQLPDEVKTANEQNIATAFQEVYNRINVRPSVVIFKGGSTSSTGLLNSGARRVYVLGQVAPGIPMVKILPQDNERSPGQETLMVLGPGNVGVAETYLEIFRKLTNSQLTTEAI